MAQRAPRTPAGGSATAPPEPGERDAAEAHSAQAAGDAPARPASTETPDLPPNGVADGSLIDAVLIPETQWQHSLAEQSPAGRLRKLLGAPVRSPARAAEALVLWYGPDAARELAGDPDALVRSLDRDIAHIDALLCRQVNAILHHPRFQQLEASWRGLQSLVRQADPDQNVRVRVLSVRWKELVRDVEQAIEFDQTNLFKKVYEDEFGTAGGEPFGVLIGDYQVHPHLTDEHSTDDVEALQGIAGVAAAAFAPFITGAHPSVLGLERFQDIERPMRLDQVFDQPEYIPWRRLRESPDARYLGLVLPRVLMREPYRDDASRHEGFRFREDVSDPDGRGYLWGNAAYAFGSVLIRSFMDSGWLADIRGARLDEAGGGLVQNLAAPTMETDRPGLVPRPPVEIAIPDDRERDLAELGLIPLCHCQDTPDCVFYSNQSVHKPKVYDDEVATANARLSAMLQYTLCAARFAHYLKVMARDKIGSVSSDEQLQDYLSHWLSDYIRDDDEAATSVKARYPLRQGRVTVREAIGSPGMYQCEMHLMPHFQLDALAASVKLKTELTAGTAA